MKLTLNSILNSINKFNMDFKLDRINVELENQNYAKAEKIAKNNEILEYYLLNFYNEKGLNLLASDFYTHSCQKVTQNLF